MKLDLLTNATVVDDAIKFVSGKYIEPESVKHKADDGVTIDKKRNNNDIQRTQETSYST